MIRSIRPATHTYALLLLVAAAACDAPPPTAHAPSDLLVEAQQQVSLVGAVVSMGVGDTATLVQYSPFVQKRLAWGDSVSWTSLSPAIVSVDGAGFATALKGGTARVIASVSARKRDTLDITVSSAVAATVSLSASSTTLNVGASGQLTAVVRDASGNVLPSAPVSYSSSDAGVATVAANGSFSAVSAGTTVLRAQSGSASATVAITVSTTAPPPPPPPSGVTITPPTLPQLMSPKYPTVTGKSWVLKATDNLQTALNSAQRGDEIVLPAGAKYTGNFVLPVKPGTAANGWILIRSDRTLPPMGTRVTPAQASLMPKIVTPNVAPALATNGAASGWWISGVEITVVPVLNYIQYGLVAFGDGSSVQNTLSRVPSDLVLERSYVHGQSAIQLSRCIALNSIRTAVMDSYIHQCHIKGFDSQAIMGWNGPGPFKITNNTLAGAGENIMFGGADPHIPNLIPSDIEISRNYIHTPASWKGTWTKKNLFELKSGQRILLEGNVLDGSWSDGQTGFAVVLKVANQSGSCTWCVTQDITMRKNIFRNIGAGFSLQGKQGGSPYAIGGLLNRVLLEDNLVENVNVAPYAGENRIVSVMNDVQNLIVRRNTFTGTSSLMQYLNLASVPAATNFAFEQNVATYGKYGFFSSWYGIGESSLKGFKGTVTFKNVVMIGAAQKGYPNGTFVSTLAAALATGMGANPTLISNATAGVIVP
jgi:hypothetical protein